MLTNTEKETLSKYYEDAVKEKETVELTAISVFVAIVVIAACACMFINDVFVIVIFGVILANILFFTILGKINVVFDLKKPLVYTVNEKTWYIIRVWDIDIRSLKNESLISLDGNLISADFEYILTLNGSRNIRNKNKFKVSISKEQYNKFYAAKQVNDVAICLSEDEYQAAMSGYRIEQSPEMITL